MSETTTTSPTVDEQIAAVAEGILEHINDEHDDAILFVARVLGDRPAATAAAVSSIDARGIEITLAEPSSALAGMRVDFAEPVSAVGDISTRLTALVASARALAADHPLTSIEHEREDIDAIKTFFTTVARVEDRSPGLRRITFGGGDLSDLQWHSPDQFFYLLLPPHGSTEMSIDRSFTWEQVRALPDHLQPRGAYYTLRHHRPEIHEIDIDVVLHGHTGPESAWASAWAARAQPGDVAALWGPRTAWEPPSDTEVYLLVADETGLPAVGAILEHLPSDASVRVVIEVADEDERQPLQIGSDVQVTWLHRDGAEPGSTTQLIDTVRALTGSDAWPAGRAYAWGGGESKAMTAVRRHLRDELGLARAQVSMVGYWRRADTKHVDDADPTHEDEAG